MTDKDTIEEIREYCEQINKVNDHVFDHPLLSTRYEKATSAAMSNVCDKILAIINKANKESK